MSSALRLCTWFALPLLLLPLSLPAQQTGAEREADGGQFAFRNPNVTRLFFAPTGRTLKKGEGYFSDFYLFLPGASYGVSDRVTIGGMMSIIPGAGLDEQLYFLTPKVAVVQKPQTNISVGALLIGWPGGEISDDAFSAGIAYGAGTWGSENSSITAGIGFGFDSGNFEKSPFIMLGGEHRVGHRVSLVTENWLLPGGRYGLVSGGVRLMGSGVAVDFGLLRAIGRDAGDVPFIPLIGFVFKF